MLISKLDKANDLLTYYIGDDPDNLPKLSNQLAVSDDPINPLAVLCNLKGDVLYKLEDRKQAIYWYIKSLKIDSLCYDSYDKLLHNYLLSEKEQYDLLQCLQYKNEDIWLKEYNTIEIKHSQLTNIKDHYKV